MLAPKSWLLLAAVACPLAAPGPVFAQADDQKVEVHMKDGSTIVADRLERRDGKIFLTVPSLGARPIEVDPATVACVGAGCAAGKDETNRQIVTERKTPEPPRFAVHGSNTIGARLMPLLLKTFSAKRLGAEADVDEGKTEDEQTIFLGGREHGGAKAVVDLAAHGSSTAFVDLAAGTANVGMASRAIKPEEVQKLVAAGFADPTAPDSEHVLGLDGLAVIVNRDNPVSSLSVEEIAKIFSGEIRDWAEVGGTPGPIKINARDGKSGTTDTFNALVMSAGSRKLSPDAQRFESSELLSDSVAQDAHGIGYIGFAYVKNAKAVAIRGKCGIVLKPNQFLIKAEQYPLSRRLLLYTKGNPTEPVLKDFMAFALSDDARSTIEEAGFIPQTVELEDFGQQGQRLATMLADPRGPGPAPFVRAFVTELRGSKLLSTSFRFRTNGTDLDTKALQDVSRVANYLKDEHVDPSRVRIVGYSDGDGFFGHNVKLSIDRASAVAQSISQAGYPLPLQNVLGFGPISPVACNDAETGKKINRRVEVWVHN